MASKITPAILQKLLSYDPETGILTWKARDRERFKSDALMAGWNTRFAGKEAGTLNITSGYRIVAVLAEYNYAHRIAYAMHHGKWPEVTDHINGVRNDNRAANLRSVSDAKNKRNLRRPTTNKSGTVGVQWDASQQKWRANIHIDGRSKNLGRFATKEDAIAARHRASVDHGFHANHGREIGA